MLLLLFSLILVVSGTKDLSKRTVYAINCGGPEHVGEGGVIYQADRPMYGTVDSDFGSKFYFINANDNDRALYQTERYSTDSFTYSFPVQEGDFVMILKFSEVYFTREGQKIFDVKLNGIPIINNLDIFKEANYIGAAYDRYIEFSVINGIISVGAKDARIGSSIDVEFVKGQADNPKVNAIAILQGGVAGLPTLPQPYQPDENESNLRLHEEEVDSWQQMEDVRQVREAEEPEVRHRPGSGGPPAQNPYEYSSLSDFTYTILLGLFVLMIPIWTILRHL